MDWFKMSAKIASDPDLATLSDRAFRYWINAISIAALHETDGIFRGVDGRKRPIWDELVAAGRFVPTAHDPQTFHIVGFEKWQISRAALEEDRAQARERMKRVRSGSSSRSFARTSREVPTSPSRTSRSTDLERSGEDVQAVPFGEFLDRNPDLAKRVRRRPS